MAKWRTKLPKQLRKEQTWGKWEKALAFAAVMPRLLAPSTKERRDRIKTLHYLDLLNRLAAAEAGGTDVIIPHLTKRFEHRWADLVNTARLRWYREQLFVSERGGKYAPSIITSGLIVKILRGDHWGPKNRRTIGGAYAILRERYRPGTVVRTSEKETEKIWRKWKHAAHLCAAFVDFLPFEPALQIDEGTLIDLEDRFDEFVATAVQYQTFLTGNGAGDEIPQATRRQFELATFDTLALSAAPFSKLDLPLWDRRPKVVGNNN